MTIWNLSVHISCPYSRKNFITAFVHLIPLYWIALLFRLYQLFIVILQSLTSKPWIKLSKPTIVCDWYAVWIRSLVSLSTFCGGAHITTTIAQDDTLDYFWPYTANNANTELVRLRKIIPWPFKYASIFLAQDVTPRLYFEAIYSAMVADNKAGDYLPLTKYFQLAFTRGGNNQPSPLDTNRLNLAPRNDHLLSVRTCSIKHYFPQINQNLTGLQ